MKIIIDNCMFMNGGDAAINIATAHILRQNFDDLELVFADSGLPAIARYYPGEHFIPLPSYTMDHSLPVRAARKLFAARAPWLHLDLRSAYLAGNIFLLKGLKALGLRPAGAVMASLAPYLDADLVLAAGGTYLVSKYDFSNRILDFQKNRLLGKPMAMFTQSIEPFADDFRTARLAPLLRRMALILVRHAESRKNIAQVIGTVDHVQPVADAVFALWKEDILGLQARRIRCGRAADDALRIAVSVRNIHAFAGRTPQEGRKLYAQSIRQAVTRLVREKGATVTFLSTCQGIPEYWTDDSRVARTICAELPEDVAAHVEIDDGFYHPLDLIEKLRCFDGVIAGRLHMAILTICANTPVMAVSYEPKFEETFSSLGLPHLVTRAAQIEPASFGGAVMEWLDQLDDIGRHVAEHAPALRDSAVRGGELLRAALARTGGSGRG